MYESDLHGGSREKVGVVNQLWASVDKSTYVSKFQQYCNVESALLPIDDSEEATLRRLPVPQSLVAHTLNECHKTNIISAALALP